ncbi:hypothetical protein [Nocardia sp. NPDC052566]|uniref:hypothetical protein n=1 Tax=Nocardia sp. NPDC052566 TaxID=3364330 RepID=UPI0037CB0FF1
MPPVPPTSKPPVPPTPPPTTTPPGPQQVYCGPGFNGLAIIAITTEGAAACSTATEVTNAYGDHAEDWGPGVVIPVSVEGTTWNCQERQGNPNPYQECVNTQNPAEKVRLSS